MAFGLDKFTVFNRTKLTHARIGRMGDHLFAFSDRAHASF
ncbi:Uncharacterised protein [Vibrio cholerae]|nr:Uncharacterised protein [Vibrio cholerae]CSE09898.1 Uncharacterised protein [Vibrio cholerae]